MAGPTIKAPRTCVPGLKRKDERMDKDEITWCCCAAFWAGLFVGGASALIVTTGVPVLAYVALMLGGGPPVGWA